MREILFRGKRTDNGEWVYGWLGHLNCYNPQAKTISSVYFTEITEDHDTRLNIIVDYKTVGQYTGLTDKNGKKIFEGDIVTNPKGDIGRVTWYEEHCAFMIYSITENKVYWLFDNDFSLIEIIGNIHDNPELLKGGER